MKRMLCMSCCTEKTFVACLFAFVKCIVILFCREINCIFANDIF